MSPNFYLTLPIMSEIDYNIVLQKHLKSLMKQADLSIIGIAEATNLSTITIRKILMAKTRASQITLNKIASLFSIKIEKLFSEKEIKLKRLDEIPLLKEFYKNNASNNTYFTSRAKENVVADFLRNTLIYDDFLKIGRRTKDVANYIKHTPKYNKEFEPKVIAKAFERMYKEGLLNREDKTGENSVFFYSAKKD